MRTLLFCVSALLTSVKIIAQAPDISVDWGPVYKSKDTDFDFIVGADAQYFYTFGTEDKGMMSRGLLGALSKTTYHLKKYDRQSYRVVYDTEFDSFEYQGKDALFIDSRLIGDEVFLYFQSYDPKTDRRFLIYRKADGNGRLEGAQLLSSMKSERKSAGDILLDFSSDSTKILTFAIPPYERKESEKFEVTVFGGDHKELWNKNVVLPYSDKYFTLTDQAITNSGDVFILGFSEPDKGKGEKRVRGESNRSYKLFRIEKNSDEILEYDLALDDKFIHSAGISGDFGSGKMAITGFYSNNRMGSLGGSFFITIDQNSLDVETASAEPFSKDLLSNILSEKQIRKGRELHSFTFRDIIKREDGGAIIVAEQYYVVTNTTRMANGATVTTTTYHYNDLLVINVNPMGTIEWSAFVPKEQAGPSGYFSSYLLLVENSRLHFIYNDDRKNLERIAEGKDVKTMTKPQKSLAVITTIEGNGEVVYDQLFRNKDFSAILVPRKSYQVNSDEVLLFGIKGSKTRFGTLYFQ